MSIKFICSCGKHLRARDEMAARRSMCPRCGAPVGIPSMRPTHAGTMAAPLTPQERRRLRLEQPMAESESFATEESTRTIPIRPHSPFDQPPKPKPKVRRRRQLEQHWYQCLAYPFLNWSALVRLSLILSVWIVGIILAIPKLPAFSLMSSEAVLPWSFLVLPLMLFAAYAFATVEGALTSALAGEGPASCWPGWSAVLPLKSAGRWLFCFLAGPIVPAGIAGYYWLNGGDLKALDWAILAELGIFAVAYWFLAIVSANERNRLRDANPLRVAQLVHRLNYRAFVPVLVAPALVIPHVLLGLLALTLLHQELFSGWLLLAACWCSILFWAAFLFRLLGVWCYHAPFDPRTY